MLEMFGRLVERMKRGSKTSAESGFLGKYIDAICPRYAARFRELQASKENFEPDALDVLSLLLAEEMQVKNVDIAASRAFLSILIENDHLPTQNQLNAQELELLRDLLLCYFGGEQDVNEKGNQVLSLIEQKFANGDFSQARILLQIFETNPETRINNERNLYYEEMIMRLDCMPSHAKPIAQNLIDDALADNADDDSVLSAFDACAQNAGCYFNLYLRDTDEYERWQKALSSLSPSVSEYLLEFVPVIRWRPIGILDEPIASQINRHMIFEMLRQHVLQKLRMCYFILLASGESGFEWFIFAFTQWSKEFFDVDVRDVFPLLHRGSIVDGLGLQESFDQTLERFYGPGMNTITLNPDDLEHAYRDSLRFILSSDLSQIPSGNYNFGGFLLDRILPFPYEDPMFAYRLHLMM